METSFRKFISQTRNSKFVRNVAIVAGGTAAAQAIGMAFAPVITRLYGPEAFGLLGVFTALTSILVPIAALTYPIAIVLPKEDSDARGIARLSIYIALVISVLVAGALFFGGERLLALLDSEAIAPYVMLVPLFLFFAACHQVARQWLIRKKQFSITARAAVIQALFVGGAKSGFGLWNPVGAVLVALATVGQAFHALLLWTGIHISKAQAETDNEVQTSLTELAKRHRDFPMYRAPQIMTNALSQSLPVLMLSGFFGPAIAGFYTLGKSVMGMPSMLIGKSVGDAFYPRITEAAHNQENLSRLIMKSTFALAAVGCVPFMAVIAFGPRLFSFVFGAEWVTAGEYARWLSIWLLTSLSARPVIAAIPVVNLQGLFLVHDMFFLALKAMAIYAGFIWYGPLHAVAFFSIVTAFSYIVLILFVYHRSIQNQNNYKFVQSENK